MAPLNISAAQGYLIRLRWPDRCLSSWETS